MINKDNYKLYRKFNEIIHPSISRKNISNYKIVLSEEINPVQVFYPKKEIDLDSIIIYIRGNNAYNNYYDNLALETNKIVILIDNIIIENKDYFKTIKYLIDEALKCKIDISNILIMSDFKGTNVIFDLENKLNDKKYSNIKKVLLSPTKYDLENCNLTNTLILSNNEEIKVNDKIKYKLIKESIYDFISDESLISNKGIYLKITNYIEGKEV